MEDIRIEKYPAYKDSGVAWLGEIPEHWDLLKAKYLWKEIVELSDSGDEILLSVSQYTGVNNSEADSRSESLVGYKCVSKNDLVVNIMLAWLGGLGLSSLSGIVSPAYAVYRLTKIANPRFLHYLYRTHTYLSEFARRSKGVVPSRWRMYTDDFGQVRTILPPLNEQTAIADFLDQKTVQIDKAIAQKEKLIELLKERRQILIHRAVTRGLNPDVRMKDSGVEWIGEIPAHWEVKRLKYILKSQGRIGFKGYTTSDLVNEGDGALTFGASHISWDGDIELSDPVYISWQKYHESPEIMVSKGDILIVQRGSTCGKVALVREDHGPATINPSLVLLKEVKEVPEYIYLGLQVVLSGILNIISTTAIPMLSQFQIDNIAVPLASRTEQIQISKYCRNIATTIEKAIKRKEKEIETVKEYKATLINATVTGKIKVI